MLLAQRSYQHVICNIEAIATYLLHVYHHHMDHEHTYAVVRVRCTRSSMQATTFDDRVVLRIQYPCPLCWMDWGFVAVSSIVVYQLVLFLQAHCFWVSRPVCS